MVDAVKKKCAICRDKDIQEFGPTVDCDWFEKHDFPKDGLLCYDCNCIIDAIVRARREREELWR